VPLTRRTTHFLRRGVDCLHAFARLDVEQRVLQFGDVRTNLFDVLPRQVVLIAHPVGTRRLIARRLCEERVMEQN